MKNAIKSTKESKSTMFITISIVIVCSILVTIPFYHSVDMMKDSIISSLENRADENAELIKQHIFNYEVVVEGIAFRGKIQSMDWSIQKPTLISELKRIGVESFQVSDLNGVTNSTNGSIEYIADEDYFINALQGNTYVEEQYDTAIKNDIDILIATPIKNEKNQIVGVLSATMNSQLLFDIVKNRKVGTTGCAFIINRNGLIISNHDDTDALIESHKVIEEGLRVSTYIKELTSGKTGSISFKILGIDQCMFYTPVEGTNLSLVLIAPKKEVFSGIMILALHFLVLILITIIVSILLGFLFKVYKSKYKMLSDLEKQIKKNEERLKESAEMDMLRTQFFANISHEFRTPLNVILASLQLFELYSGKGQINVNSINKHTKIMKQNCNRLLRLINNLIDVTRIDAGFLEVHMQNYNIINIVEEITLSIAGFTEMRGIELIFDTDIEELMIACDVDKLERIILNLLSNAIKFTQPGGRITVNIYHTEDNISISIKDTGIGIPLEKQEMIFGRFVQVQHTLSRDHEGSGIGLSLVKSFVEMHGGKISVISEHEKGSEFIIELPIRRLPDSVEEETKYYYVPQDRIEKIDVEFSDIYSL